MFVSLGRQLGRPLRSRRILLERTGQQRTAYRIWRFLLLRNNARIAFFPGALPIPPERGLLVGFRAVISDNSFRPFVRVARDKVEDSLLVKGGRAVEVEGV